MKHEAKLIFNNTKEQYVYFGLPAHGIDENTDFAIHNLKEVNATLPYR
jgi:hypothetical protein